MELQLSPVPGNFLYMKSFIPILIWLSGRGQSLRGPGRPCNTLDASTSVKIFAYPLFSASSGSGYIESCRSIVGCCKAIQRGLREQVPEVYIIGNPPASVFAFGSKSVNPLAIGDAMSRRGWHLNALGDGTGVHLACTVSKSSKTSRPGREVINAHCKRLTVPNQERFIADLKDAVAEVKFSPESNGSMVAVYGVYPALDSALVNHSI